MPDQLEYAGFGASEFAENPDPRVPCVLILDTSGSMAEVVAGISQMTGQNVMQDGQLYNVVSGGTTRIDLLNQGLLTLKESLAADSLASRRAEIAIVTFGGTVNTIQDFVTAENFQPPCLHATGGTPMGQAILTGLDMIAKRKATYRAAGVSFYRPWIFLITDGGPDPGDPWQSAAVLVKQGEASKSFAFFTVAVDGANMDVLAQIAARPPAKLKGVNFHEMFLWLSQSMQAVSQSSPGTTVALPPPGWGEV
jgi:uncharacterized protein YegL